MQVCSAARSLWAAAILSAGLISGDAKAELSAALADPEDGRIENGAYANPYFGLTLPLPSSWSAGFAGAPPSETGYYVLASFDVDDGAAGTVLITAQDEFFAARPLDDAMAMVTDLRRSLDGLDGLTIDREPRAMRIAGRVFADIEFSGAGLYRAVLATAARCHLLSFAMTARDVATRDALVHAIEGIAFSPQGDGDNGAPRCVRDYASDENLRRKVEPAPAGPAFAPIPVRLVIDADGRVAHVHVIHASAEQRRNLEEALSQWEAIPYQAAGQGIAVETGRVFRFGRDVGGPTKRP